MSTHPRPSRSAAVRANPSTAPRPVEHAAASARRAARSDGQEARKHLLLTALALFAKKGFAKTSTREIARAADVNISAISYYFGDKAGLYEACFYEPVGGNATQAALQFDTTNLSTKDALRIFLLTYMEPLKQGEIVRQCIRLHTREMLESSSLWTAQVERDLKGPHKILVGILCRHLGVPPDEDIDRLAFAITGLAMQLFVTQEFVDAINPTLMRDAAAIDRWAQQLVLYAHALLDDEVTRRAASAADATQAARATATTSAPPPSHPRAGKRKTLS